MIPPVSFAAFPAPFRPNPAGDGHALPALGERFMDYVDDACMGLASAPAHQRVTDGTSNTLMFGES